MPKPDPRVALQMRRQFWADKAANANHCRELERKADSAFVADWTRRFDEARQNNEAR